MTQCWSRFWVVCCSLVSAADVQDALHNRAHVIGRNSEADLQSATLGKPGLRAIPTGTEHNLGIAQISRGVATDAFRRTTSYSGFFTAGASQDTSQRGMSTITKQYGNQHAAVLAQAVAGAKTSETLPKTGSDKPVQEVESEDEFDKVVQSSELVMVEFTTPWCGPCKLFAPKYENMASDFSEKVRFLKVTMSRGGETWKLGTRFNVQAIPSFLLIQRGEVVVQEAGISCESKLRHAMGSACVT